MTVIRFVCPIVTATILLTGWCNVAKSEEKNLPPLPEGITSFGGAVQDGWLYTYGGHLGDAHHYYREGQNRAVRRLNLQQPEKWETIGEGPGLQGLALISHGGKLYRIGGFAARNSKEEEQDIVSIAEAAAFDPATRKWTDLAPMPEPRSSFDAVVLDSKVYVVGGWAMDGKEPTTWCTTAYRLDLSVKQAQWQPIAAPPFQRRALSVSHRQGRIFAIGGMQEKGGPTTQVDIYDPATDKWSAGPALPGEPMEGFGSSSFNVDGNLIVTTYSGIILKLKPDESGWGDVGKLKHPRFFHRLLPVDRQHLIAVGGASMESGKVKELELISVE